VRQWRRATVVTPGEWQCKIRTGGVRQLTVANGPNIFQMLIVREHVHMQIATEHYQVDGCMFVAVVSIPGTSSRPQW